MKSIEITTQIGCPVNCSYCPQKTIIKSYSKRSRIRQLSFETYKTCIDKLPLQVDIHFTGMCEPWINPKCSKMILYALTKGHSIGVSTTLQGMLFEDLRLLTKHQYKFFSIHLPTNNNTESIRTNKQYLSLLSEIVNSDLKATFHVQGNGFHPDLKRLLDYQDVIVYNPHSRAGNIKINGKTEPIYLKGKIGCSRDLKQNVLMPNGDVLLCCMDYSMKHVIGNLVKMTLEELYENKTLKEIQTGLRNDKVKILCRRCEQYAYPIGIKSKFLNKVLPKLKIYGLAK